MSAARPKKRTRTILTGVVAFALLGILNEVFQNAQSNTMFSVGVTRFQAGHYGDYYSDHFVVLFITNNTERPFQLEGGDLQCSRPNGTVRHDLNVQWRGKEGQEVASPQEAVPVPLSVDKEFAKYRLGFDYSSDAGHLRSFLSRAVRKIPQKIIKANTVDWLRERGWLDGRFHLKYETPWMANDQMQ